MLNFRTIHVYTWILNYLNDTFQFKLSSSVNESYIQRVIRLTLQNVNVQTRDVGVPPGWQRVSLKAECRYMCEWKYKKTILFHMITHDPVLYRKANLQLLNTSICFRSCRNASVMPVGWYFKIVISVTFTITLRCVFC